MRTRRLACRDEYEGQLEFDLGNLSAFDPAPVDAAQFAGNGREEALLEAARGITQSITNKLFALPAEPMQGGRMAVLPTPTTVLPRYQTLPKLKVQTKWAKFAQEKGIVKRKRGKLELDEASGEFKRRHGYDKANDEMAVDMIEAQDTDKVRPMHHHSQ